MSPNESPTWIESNVENVGDAIVAALAAGGIDHLFFTSGSEISFFQESTAKAKATGHNNPVRLVTVPLEHVTLNAALGYAAVSGKPAATAAHVECGTLNYGGAIHTAWRSDLPVVIMAGFAPTGAVGSMKGAREEGAYLWQQQVYDQNGIVRNYVKWDHMLAYQDDPGLMTSRAIQVANTEPCGPVYLSIPKELTFLPVQNRNFPSAQEMGIPRPIAPDLGLAAEIAERLARAKNPVVVVSGSGRNLESVSALVALAEMLGLAVVFSSPKFLCFPFRHPLRQAPAALKDADAVLVLETEVPWAPGHSGPPDDAYVAVIGQDPIKLRIPTYEFTADVRITADSLLSIRAIVEAAEGILSAEDKSRIAERLGRLAEVSGARIAAAVEAAKGHAKDTPIDPTWVSYQLNELLDENCILLNDTLASPRMVEYLDRAQPGSYFGSPGSSGGWSPGAAFGAKLAAPDRDVIAVTGDGYYMFGTPGPALWAATHHGAPFMVVIHTNRSYNTGTTAIARAYGKDGYAAQGGYEGGYFDPPIDFAMEAEAAGAYGENVRDPAEVGPALKRGLEQIRAGKCAVISMWEKRLEGDD